MKNRLLIISTLIFAAMPFYLYAQYPIEQAVQILTPENYNTSLLETGDMYYNDRDYTITEIPGELDSLIWIVASNDNADNQTNDFIQLVLLDDADIYIGFDSRATSVPNWLADSFSLTDLTLGVSDDAITLNVWKMSSLPDTLILGGNRAAGAVNAKSHYVILIDVLPFMQPIVEFSADTLNGSAPLTVHFTSQLSGIVTNLLWNFGDDSTSSEPNPVHTFRETGTFTVSLDATGPGGNKQNIKYSYITVTNGPPVAFFVAEPRTGFAPLAVQFINQSSGDIDEYSWDFGDEEAGIKKSPVHTYTQPDTYSVRLAVKGELGTDTLIRKNYIIVQDPIPVADFDAFPTTGVAPLSVQFTDQSNGNINAWLWDFGDGSTSKEQHPEHVYDKVDTFTVSLTVAGPAGINTITKTDLITTVIAPPVTDFEFTPAMGVVPLTVQFTDLSTGNIKSWNWDFGDGTQSTNQNPSHIYTKSDSFDVSLTVIGPGGEKTKTLYNAIITTFPVSINNQDQAPDNFQLYQNYPNPFNPVTTIRYTLAQSSTVTLSIYNIRGELLATPVNQFQAAGVYNTTLHTQAWPSGIYYYQLKTDTFNFKRKMLLIK